ncbi:MAG: hypothetical protein GX446_01545 [Chthonomonadales bacterium]|nr:hypothetical protein [Chthonomonadales bacterium]
MIEKIAMDIHRRGLETPAILFLEMHKPLSFFASQTLIVTTPLIAPIVGFDRVRNAANLLESRDNVELLIRRIEELAAARDTNAGKSKQGNLSTDEPVAEPIGASTVAHREDTK